jgi:hypothetical protein
MAASPVPLSQRCLEAVASGDYSDIISTCEALEMEGKSNEDAYMAQMLGYLLINDVPMARFLAKRCGSDAVMKIWKTLGKPLGKRDTASFFLATTDIQLAEPHGTMFRRLVSSVREERFALVGRAYTRISLADAAAQLGLAEDVCAQQAQKRGWGFDEDNQMLAPIPEERPSAPRAGIDQLEQLRRYVNLLEEQSTTAGLLGEKVAGAAGARGTGDGRKRKGGRKGRPADDMS